MHVLGTWLACMALIATPLYAQEAHVYLQDLAQGPYALGDTVNVGVYVDAGSLSITSASVYLHVDTHHWQVINSDKKKLEVEAPFSAGTAWQTTVYENQYDAKTGQLSYVAVSGLGSGGPRPVGRGRFLLATVALRIVARPEGGMVPLLMDVAGQRRPVYTRAEEPGVEYRFGSDEAVLWIRVVEYGVEPRIDKPEALLLDEVAPLELVEDGGFYRFPLGHLLNTPTWEGVFSVNVNGPVQVNVAGDTLEIEPNSDATGQAVLSVGLCLPDGRCETADWQVIIRPQNDAPVLFPFSPLSISVGSRVTVPLSTIASDVDNALSELRLEERQTAFVRVYESGGEVVVEGLAEGREELLLSVVDPQGAVGEGIWPIHVVMPSLGPEWLDAPPLEISVGEALSVDLASYVIDDDTPEIDLAWSLSGEGVDIVWQEGADASVYLSSPQSGQAVLFLQVRDPEGNEAVTAWHITVVDAVLEEDDGQMNENGPAESDLDVEEGEPAEVNQLAEELPPPELNTDPVDRADSAEELPPPELNTDPVDRADLAEELPPPELNTDPVDRADSTVNKPVEAARDTLEYNPAVDWSLSAFAPMQLEVGTEDYVDLRAAVRGIDPSYLVWEVQAVRSVSVHISDGSAVISVDSSFSGQTRIEFTASDSLGHRESTYVDLEVSQKQTAWMLGDIPDETLIEGDTLFVDLTPYVNFSVRWSVSGGEGLSVSWVAGGFLLSAVDGFSGRSVMIFTAVAEDGSQASDIVRIDVVGAEEISEDGGEGSMVSVALPGATPSELTLRKWDEITLYVGDIQETRSLDELVVDGDPALVQWSLRGGVFIDAEITRDRRIRLDGRGAQAGREVFWLTANRNGQRGERSVGIQVRLRPLALRVPMVPVSVTPEGVDLNQFVDGEAIGVLWKIIEPESMWIEENRLFSNASPGEYTVLLTARRGLDPLLEFVLDVNVPVAEVPSEDEREESTKPALQEEGAEAISEETLPPLRWSMPDSFEVEMGGSGRWPLQLRYGSHLDDALAFFLLSEGGNASIEGTDLVVVDARSPMTISLLVVDAYGREDRVEISVIPVDIRPPVVDLHGLLVGDGTVRWTILADEKIGSATLLLDEVPLVPVQRGESAVSWQHKIDEEHPSRLRALIADESGNLTKVDRNFRAGIVGAGRVLESSDGALRVLKGGTIMPLLIYRVKGAYRIEYAGEQEVEIALVSSKVDRVLKFEREGFRTALPTIWSEGRLLGRVQGAGWLSTAKGVAQVGIPLQTRCFPNPFNASVTVRLDMPDAGHVEIDVYDILGRSVRKFLAEQRSAGPWYFDWDGRDQRGQAAASGPYFIVIKAAGQRHSMRVMLLR